MTDQRSLVERLKDLEAQSERRHMHTESFFLNESEQAEVKEQFPPSLFIRYEGGYESARKKKVIFPLDEEDDFSDIVCIKAEIDQRFRTIGHRDVLGSLMSLQIDRHSFGDFWIEEDCIYLYTSSSMAKFLCDNLRRIGPLSVDFKEIEEHPVQTFYTKEIEVIVSSERIDAFTAALAHVSRKEAVEMIREQHVQINHRPIAGPDELCDNGCTISIRGAGRFTYKGIVRTTRKDRIVAAFLQDIQGKERT